MSLMRYQVDLAIPQAVYDAIPSSDKKVFSGAVRRMKALAVKINEGAANEEDTTRAVKHICHHDTGDQLCEPETAI